jgi:hypothetical protein
MNISLEDNIFNHYKSHKKKNIQQITQMIQRTTKYTQLSGVLWII